MSDQKIIIGRLGAAYGIKGWLHLHSFTDPIDNIFQYRCWYSKKQNQWLPLRLEAHKAHGNSFVIKLADCNDRESAMLLKGTEIATDRAELPKATENEYYWSDLVGLTVITLTGETLGTVDYLFETGANDVIVVKSKEPQAQARGCCKCTNHSQAGASSNRSAHLHGKKQHFIPYINGVIKTVDLAHQQLIVDWEPI